MAFTTREGKTRTELSEINMIPFIDIMLVLLIIFMMTAPVIQSGIDIDVPRTQVVRELAEEKLVVSIDREQNLYLQNEPVNINELGPLILERMTDPDARSVYLRADESVPFGSITVIMDRLNQVGIEHISVVTQPLNQGAQ